MAIALLAVRRRPVKVAAWGLGGAVAFALPVLLPFWLAGTLPEMTVHVLRAFSPGNLSSGCANVWWLVSELVTVGRNAAAVPFVRLAAVDFPCAPLATAALLILVGWIAWRQRVFSGARPAALAAATMLYAYAMVSVGVYENHPHLVLLLLFLTGLATKRLRAITAVAGTVYVLNLLALSGIGRFYGNRYLAIEPLGREIPAFRLALGFDVITLLAVVNVAVFVLWVAGLRRELESIK